MGVKKAISNVNIEILIHLCGRSPFDQKSIDNDLIALDGIRK